MDTHEENMKSKMNDIKLILNEKEDMRLSLIRIEMVLTNTYWEGVQEGLRRMKEIYNK